MLFNSYVFVFAFLPLCLIGYFALNHFKKFTLAQGYLFVMSLWFYGYFNPSYLPIILVSIVANYGFTCMMDRLSSQKLRKITLCIALLVNFGVLFYFKYYDFFLKNVNRLFDADFTLKNILLPLGISFFTFQQVSYVIDAYRGEVAQYNFLQYASFVVYFPQLIAGPIVTHDELIPQFMDESKKAFNWDNFAKGIYIFVLGLAKKVLIADVFGVAVNWGFGDVHSLDTTNAIFVALAYTFQVYFDFSGYCDMAIGLGQMMNIDLPINFDSPYKALTITEFWQRWHKTLTRFFTKYVYIPLGGNRRGKLRTYINVMIIFLISGIWHGANYTFILWGLLHGVFSVVTRHWKDRAEKMHPVVNWLITFLFLNLTWIFFRADSIAQGLTLIRRIASGEFGPIHYQVANAFNLVEFRFLFKQLFSVDLNAVHPNLMMGVYYAGTFLVTLGTPNARERMLNFKGGIGNMVWIAILLVWCIISFSGVSTFLYFNF